MLAVHSCVFCDLKLFNYVTQLLSFIQLVRKYTLRLEFKCSAPWTQEPVSRTHPDPPYD